MAVLVTFANHLIKMNLLFIFIPPFPLFHVLLPVLFLLFLFQLTPFSWIDQWKQEINRKQIFSPVFTSLSIKTFTEELLREVNWIWTRSPSPMALKHFFAFVYTQKLSEKDFANEITKLAWKGMLNLCLRNLILKYHTSIHSLFSNNCKMK